MKIKTLILCAALFTLTLLCNAQDRALKFLGIPVDGYKSEMIQKLRDKGYIYSKNGGEDVLTGEFNGTDVNIYIVTNNNKVADISLNYDSVLHKIVYILCNMHCCLNKK